MRIIFTIASLASEFGGPSRSVPALATALGRLGADVEIITASPTGTEGPPLLPPSDSVRSHLVPVASRSGAWWARANAFAKTLRARCAGQQVVIHDQGLWLASNHAVAATARELGQPLVISPRGMLSSWALAAKSLKKKAAWLLYQRRDLMSAAAIHVTSQPELDECRDVGYRGRVAVVANGTELPPQPVLAQVPKRDSPSHVRTVLCLSRLHPKKGIPSLLQAWAHVQPGGWRLIIAGRDENGYATELKRLATHLQLRDSVDILGEVDGDAKWTLYRSASLFVLPSHSENFGLVVAEALASGVPVITTHGTPWSALEDTHSGWWVATGAAPLTAALRQALSTPPIELRAMGERGRRLVESKYTWDVAARSMLAFYESVIRNHSQ